MDLLKMIAELQTEKERLDEAILALERLSTANTRHRGRPSRGLREGRLREEVETETEANAE
jgi:hypothetical protein